MNSGVARCTGSSIGIMLNAHARFFLIFSLLDAMEEYNEHHFGV
jgi:hypothetical protein